MTIACVDDNYDVALPSGTGSRDFSRPVRHDHGIIDTFTRPGGEMADAEGLNPSGPNGPYGFDPRPGHL